MRLKRIKEKLYSINQEEELQRQSGYVDKVTGCGLRPENKI